MNQYIKILCLFVVAAGLNSISPMLLSHLAHLDGVEATIASTLWCMSLIFSFGWTAAKVSEGTIFPSFTLQLLVSIVLHDALAPIAPQIIMIVVICTILGAIILKAGGDEVERRLFAKIALPTVLIAIGGYLITFFASYALFMAIGLDGKLAALLSAIIGSTDPAALIPTLKSVVFKPQHQKLVDISVAESALNDAVGAIFTGAIITMIQGGVDVNSIASVLHGVTEVHNLAHLGQQFLFGTIAGLIGWQVMRWYEKQKTIHPETDYDFAMIILIPLLTFVIAQALHGNGFLAAFIAGLLANYNHGNHSVNKTLEAMTIKIESIAKPTIFMMVGPLISLQDLWNTAGTGLVISLLFMFVARPIAVFISLLPTNISFKEKAFLCTVRETGVIPVVLAVVTVSQFPNLTTLMPLVAWVVIWTLTILPAITPWWAKKLGLTEDSSNSENRMSIMTTLTIAMTTFLTIFAFFVGKTERIPIVIVLGFVVFLILHLKERGWSLSKFLNDPKNFQYKLGFRLRSAKWFNDKLPQD